MTSVKIILTSAIVLAGFAAMAQQTKGGSTREWQRYDVSYDTVYTTVTENVYYPSTSTSYMRIGLVRGRGLWAEPSRAAYPEDGFKGEDGLDMNSGFEIFFGGWTNMTEINKGLHPAIDLSTTFEMGLQVYSYNLSEDTASLGYEVDYGSTYSFSTRWGLGATVKPLEFAGLAPDDAGALLVDVGANLGIDLWGTGETTYDNPNGSYGSIYYDDESFIGARLNFNFHLGVRYKFIGAYVEMGRDLSHLFNPTYDHDLNSYYYESFDEEVEFNTLTYGVSIHF